MFDAVEELRNLQKADETIRRINYTIDKHGVMNDGVMVALGDAEFEAGVIAKELSKRGYSNDLINKYKSK
ncbi:MAG: hypothetical protein PHI87_05135 [Candidatus Methanomethylophilus sp.]|nr:hypothetical protein [Methanomethylophilus sp.]